MTAPAAQIAAAQARGQGRSPRAALLTLLAAVFINMLGFGVVVPLLPFYAKSFQAPAWQVALIFSAYSIGAFFGEPFWGRLSDRIGRKPLLLSTIAGNCLCYGALAFAPNVYIAFGVRLLGGLASGNGSVVQGYIADVTPVEDRPGRMSWLGAAWNLGFILGPTLGGYLAQPEAGPTGFRIPLLAASGLAALSCLSILVFVRESRTRTRAASTRANRWALLGFAVRDPAIGRLMLVTLLAGAAFMGVESIFGLWTHARFAWGPRQVATAFMVTGLVSATCQIALTGRLSRRFGPAPMLAGGMALMVACLWLQPFTAGGFAVIALLAVSAFGQSVAFPNVSALISERSDPDHQGQLLGLNNATGALARVLGPFGCGLAMDRHIDGPFVLAGLIAAPAVWLALKAGRIARAGPGGV